MIIIKNNNVLCNLWLKSIKIQQTDIQIGFNVCIHKFIKCLIKQKPYNNYTFKFSENCLIFENKNKKYKIFIKLYCHYLF